MEGEDISPAVALASAFSNDPFDDDATTFIFGNSDGVGANATQTPTDEETATATATSAPNSPASASSASAPVNPTYVTGSASASTATTIGGLSTTTWLLIGAAALLGFYFFDK